MEEIKETQDIRDEHINAPQETEIFSKYETLRQEYIAHGGKEKQFAKFIKLYGVNSNISEISKEDDLFFEHKPLKIKENLTTTPTTQEKETHKIENPMDEYYIPGTTIRKRRH